MLDHSCQVQRHTLAERGHDPETPAVAVEAPIWEPACGRGAIANILRAHGHRVVCTDLIDYGISTAICGMDFLKTSELPPGVSTILTNPPYKLANEFVAHALELCPNVIMLLRLAFLESERRCPVLDGAGLNRVLAFRKRLPMMHRDGWQGRRRTAAWLLRGSYGSAAIGARRRSNASRGRTIAIARRRWQDRAAQTKVRRTVRRSSVAPIEPMCLRACVETVVGISLSRSKLGRSQRAALLPR
jgi:hypothetical protein